MSDAAEITLRSLYTVVEHVGPTFSNRGTCGEDTPGWELRPFVVDSVLPLDSVPRLVERIE